MNITRGEKILSFFQEEKRYIFSSSQVTRALKLLISNQMNPARGLYDQTFYINLKYPQGIIYNPYPEGCRCKWRIWRRPFSKYYLVFRLHSFLLADKILVFSPHRWFLDLSTMLNKMAISKFWLDVLRKWWAS